MLILATDTSTPIASVALMSDEQVLAEAAVEVTNMHTARLIPLIDDLLRWTDHPLDSVDALVIGLGPGSFTGTRIAVSTIKSIAYALSKPLVGICILDAIAMGLQHTNLPLCVMLDARRDEVYAAVYEQPPRRSLEILCVSVESLMAQLSTPALLVGNGTQVYRDRIETHARAEHTVAEPLFNLPRASLMVQLALPRLQAGETDDAMAITPIYARKLEAQVQYATGRIGRKTLL